MVPDSMLAVNLRVMDRVPTRDVAAAAVQVAECAKDMSVLWVALRSIFV
jgi:hypothetical protein